MREKLYTVRVEICITPEQKQILVALSKKYKRTVNEIIRACIMHEGKKV